MSINSVLEVCPVKNFIKICWRKYSYINEVKNKREKYCTTFCTTNEKDLVNT